MVRQNPPFIFGRLVSLDQKGALITAGFISDRLNSRETFMAVFNHIQQIKKDEEDENTKIYLSGYRRSWQAGCSTTPSRSRSSSSCPIAAIFALLWAYFRRWHGVLIPAVAALSPRPSGASASPVGWASPSTH